jgi:hypothetical protein
MWKAAVLPYFQEGILAIDSRPDEIHESVNPNNLFATWESLPLS